MTITNDNLLLERPHHSKLGGVQRIYRFANGMGLSVVNTPMLHSYPFAWEIAVIKGVDDNGNGFDLVYDTPLTNDVEVFYTDIDTDIFIQRALDLFGAP